MTSLDEDEDALADETRVHTLSRQAIAEMLDASESTPSSPARPATPSGIRMRDGSAPEPAGPAPSIPRAAAVARVWEEDEEDELDEPTLLSERLFGRPSQRTELLLPSHAYEPAIVVRVMPMPPQPPELSATAATVAPIEQTVPHDYAHAIFIAAFVVTLIIAGIAMSVGP